MAPARAHTHAQYSEAMYQVSFSVAQILSVCLSGKYLFVLKIMSTPSPVGSSVSCTGAATIGRPKRSPVWHYFEYDELQGKRLCQILKTGPTSPDSDVSKICGHKVEWKFPTNLWQHLKKAHPDVFSEIVKKDSEEQEKKTKRDADGQKASLNVSKQMTLVESIQTGPAYDKTNLRYKAITRKLAIFVGTTNVPNSIIENLAFKYLLHTKPNYSHQGVKECLH